VRCSFLNTPPFSRTHMVETGGVMPGDRDGQSHFEIILSPTKLSISSVVRLACDRYILFKLTEFYLPAIWIKIIRKCRDRLACLLSCGQHNTPSFVWIEGLRVNSMRICSTHTLAFCVLTYPDMWTHASSKIHVMSNISKFGQQMFETAGSRSLFSVGQEAGVPGQQYHGRLFDTTSRACQSPATADVRSLQLKPGAATARPAPCYLSLQADLLRVESAGFHYTTVVGPSSG
jgi:hypothetical protein